ncbi:MAG: alpha-xylosidase [Wenzhouxiangellaceae bacterium]|nr:alpha-xylosidase [Wenzhouxiangellaceae bacterium]
MLSIPAHCYQPTAPDWDHVPAVQVTGIPFVDDQDDLVVPSDAGPLRISLLECGLRLRMGSEPTTDYAMLKRQPASLRPELELKDDHCIARHGSMALHIEYRPFTFDLLDGDHRVQRSSPDGQFVRRFRLPPLARINEGWLLTLELDHDEPVYGLGEKWGPLNRRGQLIRSCNHDALGVNAELSYKNAPFCWSNRGWGVFVHTPAAVTHAVGCPAWSHRSYVAMVEDDHADIFLLRGDNGADILDHYTRLSGRAPSVPDWSLGIILSKAYYKTADEVIETARKARASGMPCDVITLDGRAWQDTHTRFAFEWDPARYPDPKKVIDELKRLNFRVCVWEYPLISIANPLFDRLEEKGWLIRDRRTGKAFRYHWNQSGFGEVLTPLPESGLLDFTHPEARAFWRDSHKPLFDLGVNMIKADFGEQVDDPDMIAHNGATGIQLRNVYALLYNRTVHEAAEQFSSDGAFVFSRSGWTGSQCHPSQWGGDPQADWGGLAASIRGGLSWGMSGAPFYASDVGGFYKDTRDPVLYARWCQVAIFSAHMRLHGIGQREPYSYEQPASSIAMKALQLRYRLLPYIRQVVAESCRTGLPAQRAMALAFPDQALSWPFEHQFLFGDDLLVAPCLNPDGKVHFYLPEGTWRRFEPAGQRWQGGRDYSLTLPLDEMAVFVRDGCRIPLGPDRQFTRHANEQVEIVESWPHE